MVHNQPCHSLVLTRVGLDLQPAWRQRLLGCACCVHREAAGSGQSGDAVGGVAQGARAPRIRRPWPAELLRWEPGASALLPIFPVSVLYCFLLLKLTCLIGNWCRIVSRGLLWNISTAVSFN